MAQITMKHMLAAKAFHDIAMGKLTKPGKLQLLDAVTDSALGRIARMHAEAILKKRDLKLSERLAAYELEATGLSCIFNMTTIREWLPEANRSVRMSAVFEENEAPTLAAIFKPAAP